MQAQRKTPTLTCKSLQISIKQASYNSVGFSVFLEVAEIASEV